MGLRGAREADGVLRTRLGRSHARELFSGRRSAPGLAAEANIEANIKAWGAAVATRVPVRGNAVVSSPLGRASDAAQCNGIAVQNNPSQRRTSGSQCTERAAVLAGCSRARKASFP